MIIPDWADEALSRDLPILRSRGESQELEYKSEFPSNVRDLGKEISAFASSNTGTILVGVANSGDLIGLPECNTPEGRDQIIRRLEGIAKGTVKPSITPTAKFAVENNVVVLVITVPKGSQPVYYSSNTPYIRHLTQACPAEPHEVIELISDYLKRNLSNTANTQSDEKFQFYTELARVLADILVIVDEAEERQINPWLDMWRSDFGYAATEIRNLAVSSIASEENFESELRQLADSLDHVANMRLFSGSGGDLNNGVKKVSQLASEILQRHFKDATPSEDSLVQVRELIRTTALKLTDLSSRAIEMVDSGRIEELQTQASNLAKPLTRIAHYKIDTLGQDIKLNLQQVARTLHLTETMHLYMDGGMSVEAIIKRISECGEALNQISKNLNR